MFFRTTSIKKETKKKIDIIYSGKNLEELIESVIKYSDVTLAVAPNKNQQEFINEFNSHKSQNNRMKKSIIEMEEKSMRLGSYMTIHKEEYEMLKKSYEELQKFKKFRSIDIDKQEEIKEKSKSGLSQRAIAKEFGTSVATVNKILNNKY